MITIDLLPPEDAAAAAAARRARSLGTAIVVTGVVGLLLAHAVLEIATAVTQRRLVRTGAELASLERPVAALRRLRDRQAALRRRLAVIAGLEARRTSPARLLDGLATAASPHLWLTEVTLAEGRLRLTGLATDERTITDFLDRLRDTGALAALDLEEAGRDDRATPPARRFVVAGRVGEER